MTLEALKFRTAILVTLGSAGIIGSPLFAQDITVTPVFATQSLFDKNSDGSVAELLSNQPVGSLFGNTGERTLGDYFHELTEDQQKGIIDRAYPLKAAKWGSTELFVCWEEFDDEFADERMIVETAVKESWGAASALNFNGWGHCKEDSVGIRITVRDEGPHTLKLGRFLDMLKGGVVLNFTYTAWEPGCAKSDKIRDFCTRTTAVHEFGHAIGFSHEQNRPDTPDDCTKKSKPQGEDGDDTELTPWDKHSVMNYCNLEYLNNGALSEFDKKAVKEIYG